MKLLKFIATVFLFTGCFFSCEKSSFEDHKDGVVPSSIDQVVNVFELKYGEVYEWEYGGQVLKFSIKDVEDNFFLLADNVYITPEDYNNFRIKSRIHAFLRVEFGSDVLHLKVSSTQWGGNVYEDIKYINNGLDVQYIWDLLEKLQLFAENNANMFEEYFLFHFGEGTSVNKTLLSIFMAKAYPFAFEMSDKPEKSMYKFIFIITNQKEK